MKKSIITKHRAHICPNGCCIYTGNNLKQQQCPVCATSRCKDGTKRPRKVFHYYSLIEYLTWLFSTRKFGSLATTHHTGADVEQDDLKFEIQETEMWKGLYANDGFFQGESRGLSLSVSTDGLSPFRTNPKYGIWPITVTIENLPRSVRNELAFFEIQLITDSVSVEDDFPVDEGGETTFKLIDAGTKRGRPKLADSVGYSYTVKEKKLYAVYWTCSRR
ncbi:hypothetical protein Bbelb_193320 [Branchiostoma belcheri]|nr:hypothetical protein Bbelb_193320 [Branchiostoma belcheri]